MGTLCLLQGVADVAAFSGYSLWLLTKSNSPAGRHPQYQNIKTNQNNKKTMQRDPQPLKTTQDPNKKTLIQIPQSQTTNDYQHATNNPLEHDIVAQNHIMRLQTNKMPNRSDR